jgi:hypothetical protein
MSLHNRRQSQRRIRSAPGRRRTRLAALLALAMLTSQWGCSRCLQQVTAPEHHVVFGIQGYHNPEDMELVDLGGRQSLLVSNNSTRGLGSIAIQELPATPALPPTILWPHAPDNDYDLNSPLIGDRDCRDELGTECRPFLSAGFSPHGLSTARLPDGTLRVAVVDHRLKDTRIATCAHAFDGRDAIELFDLGTKDGAPSLTWRGCVRMEKGTRGNDVGLAPDGGTIVVANFNAHFWSLPLGLFAQSGDLRRWRPGVGWDTLVSEFAHNPNGVVVTADAIYVSASTSGMVWKLSRDGRPLKHVCVGGYPDNLNLTSNNTLLVATHTKLSRFMRCGRSGCPSPWAVYELSPDLSQFQPITASDGTDVSLVSSAVIVPSRNDSDPGSVYFGSIAGDHIGMMTLPRHGWAGMSPTCCAD